MAREALAGTCPVHAFTRYSHSMGAAIKAPGNDRIEGTLEMSRCRASLTKKSHGAAGGGALVPLQTLEVFLLDTPISPHPTHELSSTCAPYSLPARGLNPLPLPLRLFPGGCVRARPVCGSCREHFGGNGCPFPGDGASRLSCMHRDYK